MMKTCLWSPSWVAIPGYRARLVRHLAYYGPLKEALGFQDFFFFDNGSPREALKEFDCANVRFYRFDTSLTAGPMGTHGHDYPYAWRNAFTLPELFRLGYEKVIICADDAFILTSKLAEFLKNTTSGFVTTWSEHYRFPSSEISVLCIDQFDNYCRWMYEPWQNRITKELLEHALPYTEIRKDFRGDRYGDFSLMAGFDIVPQQAWMDFYGQAREGFQPVFDMQGAKPE